MYYKYYPIEFSSYEDYVKYLKEQGLALDASNLNIYWYEKVHTYWWNTKRRKIEPLIINVEIIQDITYQFLK